MTYRVRSYLLLMVLLLQNFVAQSHAFYTKNALDIPLSISAKDKKLGLQLKPKLTITPLAGGNALPTKEVDGQIVVMVTKGERYKIVAELEGYRTFQRTFDSSIYQEDGANMVLEMEQLPSAKLVLKAVDENGEAIDANFKVSLGEEVWKGKTSKEASTYRIFLSKSDLYQVEVQATGYKTLKENVSVEIAEPSRQYNKTYNLERPGSKVQIKVFADDTEQLLKGVKINVKTDTETLFDATAADGTTSIESVFGKNYNVTVENVGYVKQTFNFKGSLEKEYKIVMQSETLVSMGAFNKITGRRVPALFKITDPQGKSTEIQGKPDADIKYKPSGKGSYQVEIIAKNFKPFKENVVIENLSAGSINHKFQIESFVEDFIILVRDIDDKQFVANPIVKVYEDGGKEVEVKNNQKTGEILVQLEKTKDYKIKVEAPEYQPYNEGIQRGGTKLIGVNLKKYVQSIVFSAIDALTKQPLLANYKLIRADISEPTVGISDATRQFKAEIAPQKTYLLEVTVEGYNPIKENILFDNAKKDPEIQRVIEFQKGAYPFSFKVVDASTKKELENVKLKILNLGNSQPVPLQTNKNIFTGNLAVATNYLIEAQADGYDKNSITINSKELNLSGKGEYEVMLSKNPYEKYKVLVIDEGNNNKVSNALVKILNSKNEAIATTNTANLNEWITELRIDESYTIDAKAEGFLPYLNPLTKNPAEKTITVKLQRVPKHEIIISAVDAFTKKPVVAEFKITTNGNSVVGTTQAGGIRYKATLAADKSYEVEINVAGYNSYKDLIKPTETNAGTKVVELRKESYPITFKIIDFKTKKPISNPKLTFTHSNNSEEIPTKYSMATNEFQANIIPDKSYKLQIEANGYEVETQALEANTIISAENLNQTILLNPIAVVEKPKEVVQPTDNGSIKGVVVESKQPEKPIEAPKPVPPAPKKEPEKKVVFIEAPMEINSADLTNNFAEFKQKTEGKRFRLSELYFEQSSPIIQPKSYPQLDKLVETLRQNKNLIIEITGHTDNVGDPRQNLYLSEQRARVVANYLFNKGIPNELIKYFGKGSEVPIAMNDTEENRSKNRRVEFVFREQ